MRIFDRIASGQEMWNGVTGDPWPAALRKPAHEYQRVVCDEAAIYETTSKRKAVNVQKNGWGPFRLPFSSVWFEWKVPHEPALIFDNGVHTMAVPEDIALLATSSADELGGYSITLGPQVIYRESHGVNVLPIRMLIRTTKDGQFIEVRSNRHSVMDDDSDPISAVMPVFITVGWLNMRNFALERVSVDPKVARKRRKKNQVVGGDYYKVSIAEKYRKDWEKRSGGSFTRFHHVIGHPATYTTPLGGHPYGFVGTLWRPGHTRGHKSLGTINKEYHVTDEAAQ